MTGILANLLLNILIVALLAATISYCWILNRRIKILQDSKSELAQLLAHFDESTQRASESIIALQTASKRIGENIQHRIEKANYLIDDLGFMIERGTKIASQIEAGFAVNRARARAMDETPEAEAEKLPVAEVKKAPEKIQSQKERTVASLEAVLERVVGRRPSEPTDEELQAKARSTTVRGRSKAEQELLDMLKTGIKG